MNSSNVSQRKKRRNNSKCVLQIPVSRKEPERKQKAKLSHEYKENEVEVQKLLESVTLDLNLESSDSKDNDLDSSSIEFFCSERRTYTASSATDEKLVSSDEDKSELEKEGKQDKERDSNISSSSSKTTEEQYGTVESTSTRDGNQTQTASTFIQIESAHHDLLVYFRPRLKYTYDDQLLFKPKANTQRNMKVDTQSVVADLTANKNRMLNRFYKESKSINEKLSKAIVNILQNSSKINAFLSEDSTLYRSFCLHEFHPIFCSAAPNPIEIPIRQLIKLYLKELHFTQHPHLCEEHRVANELEDMYEKYSSRQKTNIVETIEKDLQIERNVVSSLMNKIASEESNQRESISPFSEEQHLKTLQEHLLKIKELRTRLYEEEAYNKRLLKAILDKWLQLKKLRQIQEFQCTRFQLRIQVWELTNQMINNARKEWAIRFQTDLSELYREELETYYSARRIWKQRQDVDPSTHFSTCFKPKKPSLSNLSAELQKKYSESFYMPEQPKIHIYRSRVSDDEFYENIKKMINNGNHQRKLRSYLLKIYFDQEFVAESRTYRIEPDLIIKMNEAIGIYLDHRLPKEIVIVLFEKSRISVFRKISKVTIPLPQLLASQSENTTLNIEFLSKKEPMAGRLCLSFKCDKEPTSSDFSLKVPCLPAKGSFNSNLNLDTSDEDDTMDKESVETCTFEENLLQFCSIEELKCNPRVRLLHSRYLKNNEKTRNIRFVPALENELEFDFESEEDAVIDTGNWMDPIDLHKHRGKKYIKTLYEAIRNQCSRLDKVVQSAENLLIGDEPGSWNVLFKAIASILHPERPLNPIRDGVPESKCVSSLQWDGLQKFNIILNVVRATGIPVRASTNYEPVNNDDGRQKSSESSNIFITQNLKYSNVRPFVAMSYKDKFCRTLAAEGSNPTWNEQLVLQLSGSLTDLREDLKIVLFDEVIESHFNDDMNATNINQRIQANYLGEYRLPISTILKRRKSECNIEFNMPKIILGYRKPTLDGIATGLDTNIIVEIKESVQLFFYISIEPTCDLPSINSKMLECSELREVRQQLSDWSLMVREVHPERFIDPLICTEDGKRVCITRLLEPIPLPFESSDNLLDSICRYVSLLNNMKCYDPCMGYKGVWLSNQILLDTTWGSPKDLGVLLCNFSLALGLKCWLILGQSNTRGEMTFVLLKTEDNNMQLLEPCSGKRYFIKDVFAPLSSVKYVVAQENIYCNIQSEPRVTMMNFNFNDSSCWLPAFSKRNPAPLGGIQNLNYLFHDPLNVDELSKNIQRKIIKKVNSWRSMRKTIWNRALQSHLYSYLLELESKSTFINTNILLNSTYADQIADEYPMYKLYGFTLNFSYTNLSAISERIRTTGIHLNSDKNVEFSLAVYVHKYPNNVLSVWIFLVSIVPITATLLPE